METWKWENGGNGRIRRRRVEKAGKARGLSACLPWRFKEGIGKNTNP